MPEEVECQAEGAESLVANDILCFLHSYSPIFPTEKLRGCVLNEFSKESLTEALSMVNTVLGDETHAPTSKNEILEELITAHERVEKMRDSGNTVPVFVSRDLRSIPFDIQDSPSISGHVLMRILQELQSLKTLIVSNFQRTTGSISEHTPRPNLSLTVDCSSDNAPPALNNSGNSGTSSELSPTKLAVGSPESPSEGLLGIRGSVRKRGPSANLESAVERLKQRKVSPTQPERPSPNVQNAAKSLGSEFACKGSAHTNGNCTSSRSPPGKNSLPTASLPNISAHVNGLFNDGSMQPPGDWLYHQQQQWYHAYVNSLQNIQLMMAQKHNSSPRTTNPNVNPLSGLSLLPSNTVPVTQAMHSPPGSVWPSFSSSGWSEGALPNGRTSKISPNNTATATSSLSGDVASSVAGHSIKEEPEDMEDDSPELDDDLDDFNLEYKHPTKGEDDPISPSSDNVDSNAGSAKGAKGIGSRNSKLLNDAIDKPHECPYPNCTKRFANKFLWKKHVFIHTGERPYECHHCHKKFNRKDNLLRHKKTHNLVSYGQGRRRTGGDNENSDMSLLATSPYSFQPAMAQLLAAAAAATSQPDTAAPGNSSLVGLLTSNVPSNVEL